MNCKHRFGWVALNDHCYECVVCGIRVDKETCDRLTAEESELQANCQHTKRKQVRGVNWVHNHCCNCGKLLD